MNAVLRTDKKNTCRLCNEEKLLRPLKAADKRICFQCGQCMLIGAAPENFLSVDEERVRYETHNNCIENEGYVAFLNRFVKPMLDFIRPGMFGLDYGCGPGPVLSTLIRREGIACDDFDPIFFPELPEKQYDFIISTETFEHFYYPRQEINKLAGMIQSGGYLGIMTEMWETQERFETWYYTRDPTHVSFYHRDTFGYICQEFRFTKKYSDERRVVILQKT